MDSAKASAKRGHWIDRLPVKILGIVVLAVLILSAAGAIFLSVKGRDLQVDNATKDDRIQTAENKAASGQQLAGENLKACKDPDIVQMLQEKGYYPQLCEFAVAVQTQGSKGDTGDRGPGPTQQQINQAVEDYFRAHPLPEGKPPTVQQVASAVGDYLRANPPAPGRPPTSDEIAVATAAYIAAHAEDFRGETGEQGGKGERGPGPTAEDVASAVASYCAVDDRCRGDQGPQGISVVGTELYRVNGACTLFFIRMDPSHPDAEPEKMSVQVNDELCPPDPTPTSEVPEPTQEGG
jgi:hypothetical protein